MIMALIMYAIFFIFVPAIIATIYISIYKSMRRHSKQPNISDTSRWATVCLAWLGNTVVHSPIGGILIIDAILACLLTILFYPDSWGWLIVISLAVCCIVSVAD